MKAHAGAAGLTLGQYLDRLADGADRQARLASVRDAMAAASPAELASWAAETAEWETTELADARSVFPSPRCTAGGRTT